MGIEGPAFWNSGAGGIEQTFVLPFRLTSMSNASRRVVRARFPGIIAAISGGGSVRSALKGHDFSRAIDANFN